MISKLDLIIRQSLKDLVNDVFDRSWFGRERELLACDVLLFGAANNRTWRNPR